MYSYTVVLDVLSSIKITIDKIIIIIMMKWKEEILVALHKQQ